MEHEPDTVLHLNQPTGERSKDSNILQEDVSILEEAEFKCDYWRCHFKSNNLNQSYVYPNLTVKIQCADCDKMCLEDHKYALPQ